MTCQSEKVFLNLLHKENVLLGPGSFCCFSSSSSGQSINNLLTTAAVSGKLTNARQQTGDWCSLVVLSALGARCEVCQWWLPGSNDTDSPDTTLLNTLSVAQWPATGLFPDSFSLQSALGQPKVTCGVCSSWVDRKCLPVTDCYCKRNGQVINDSSVYIHHRLWCRAETRISNSK